MRSCVRVADRVWLQISRVAACGLLWAACGVPLAGQQMAARSAARYEMTAASVAAALAGEGLAVTPEHLQMAMPVAATVAAPALHITEAALAENGSLRLRIVCRVAGECMPFFASVTVDDRVSALRVLSGVHPISAAAAVTQPTAAAQSLAAVTQSLAASSTVVAAPRGITVGERVTLQLTDAQMHIQLPAVAIDTGAAGAEVRVASLDRRHTYRGVVVDADTVRGGVQ